MGYKIDQLTETIDKAEMDLRKSIDSSPMSDKHRQREDKKRWVDELKIERAKLMDEEANHNDNKEKLGDSAFTFGDINIITGKIFILGLYSISSIDTYNKLKDCFQKDKDICLLKLEGNACGSHPLLREGQFSSGIKFLYALVKYIDMRNDKKNKLENGSYSVTIDDKFIDFFMETGKVFDFLNTRNVSLDNKSPEYRRGCKSYCKKILAKCSAKVRIQNKKSGSNTGTFFVKLEI